MNADKCPYCKADIKEMILERPWWGNINKTLVIESTVHCVNCGKDSLLRGNVQIEVIKKVKQIY